MGGPGPSAGRPTKVDLGLDAAPSHLAPTPSGAVYVVSSNAAVREVTSGGVATKPKPIISGRSFFVTDAASSARGDLVVTGLFDGRVGGGRTTLKPAAGFSDTSRMEGAFVVRVAPSLEVLSATSLPSAAYAVFASDERTFVVLGGPSPLEADRTLGPARTSAHVLSLDTRGAPQRAFNHEVSTWRTATADRMIGARTSIDGTVTFTTVDDELRTLRAVRIEHRTRLDHLAADADATTIAFDIDRARSVLGHDVEPIPRGIAIARFVGRAEKPEWIRLFDGSGGSRLEGLSTIARAPSGGSVVVTVFGDVPIDASAPTSGTRANLAVMELDARGETVWMASEELAEGCLVSVGGTATSTNVSAEAVVGPEVAYVVANCSRLEAEGALYGSNRSELLIWNRRTAPK